MKKLLTMLALILVVLACDKNDNNNSFIKEQVLGLWKQTEFKITEAGKATGWKEDGMAYWELKLLNDATLRDNFFVSFEANSNREPSMERGYGSYYIDDDILVTNYIKGIVNGETYTDELECEFFYRIISVNATQMELQFIGDNDDAHGDNNIADLSAAKAAKDYLYSAILTKQTIPSDSNNEYVGYWDQTEFEYLAEGMNGNMHTEFQFYSDSSFVWYNFHTDEEFMIKTTGSYVIDGEILGLNTNYSVVNCVVNNNETTFSAFRILEKTATSLKLGYIGLNNKENPVCDYVENIEDAQDITDYLYTVTLERE